MLFLIIAATYGLAAAWAGLGFMGARLLWAGMGGAKVGNHPHCRACGFDLFGTASARCPECGGLIAGARAIERGTRQVSGSKTASGAALIALTAFTGGAVAVVDPSALEPAAARETAVSTCSSAGAGARP